MPKSRAACSRPVSVLAETTTSQLGLAAASKRTSGRPADTSPMLTA